MTTRTLEAIEAELRALGRPVFDWSQRGLVASKAAIAVWEAAHPDLAAKYVELAAERAASDAVALAAYRRLRQRPQLPGLTLEAALKATETPAIRGVREWLAGPAVWCLILGPRGTGKSVAARWAVEELAATGRWARMTTAVRVGRLSTWDDAGELDRLESADLLAVDDVGTEPDTDHARVTLRSLLDERHERGRRTILTSNLIGGQLSRWLGERITDRILSSYVRVETSGASLRGKPTQGETR